LKKLYVIIFFLIFVNLINVMVVALDIFPVGYVDEFDENITNASEGEEVFEYWTEDDFDYGDILGLIFGSTESIAVMLLGVGGSVGLAWLTHSTAPLAVGILASVFAALYTNTVNIFNSYPVNNYIMLACTIGMVILFVITSAEYLTQGEA
jgi:hypothetical protein